MSAIVQALCSYKSIVHLNNKLQQLINNDKKTMSANHLIKIQLHFNSMPAKGLAYVKLLLVMRLVKFNHAAPAIKNGARLIAGQAVFECKMF